MRVELLVAVALLTSCGGAVAGSGDGGQDASVDAGWTQCSSPDGLQVCGAATSCGPCPVDQPCDTTFTRVGLCNGYGYPVFPRDCKVGAVDGRWCIAFDEGPTVFYDERPNLGTLLAKNGAASRVRFGDMSAWSEDAGTPEPTECPALSVAKACGGMCGGCSSGFVCVGRGPLHPVGFCREVDWIPCDLRVDDAGVGQYTCADPSQSCFSLRVQPEVQRQADQVGVCYPTAKCDELAKNLPGGGVCSR